MGWGGDPQTVSRATSFQAHGIHNSAGSIPWFSATGIEFRDESRLRAGGGRLILVPTLTVHHGEEVKAGGA